jgi:hypothetical protein
MFCILPAALISNPRLTALTILASIGLLKKPAIYGDENHNKIKNRRLIQVLNQNTVSYSILVTFSFLISAKLNPLSINNCENAINTAIIPTNPNSSGRRIRAKIIPIIN